MPTQVSRESTGEARVVHYPPNGGEVRETKIERFPFTVGRSEESSLPVNSGRISRDHAVITCEDGTYQLRDLGSTNGTFLNGRQVSESATLSDGDIIVFADIEFAFYNGDESVLDAATQVIESSSAPTTSGSASYEPDVDAGPDRFSNDWVGQLRRTHELLMHRGTRAVYRHIVDLETAQLIGIEPHELLDDPRQMATDQPPIEDESQLDGRRRWLWRQLTLESAGSLPELQSHQSESGPQSSDGPIFVLGLNDSEIGTERLFVSISVLSGIETGNVRPVIAIPDRAISDTPYMVQLHDLLRDYGFLIMHHNFNSSGGQLAERTRIRPDFVRLPATMTRGIDQNVQRQNQVDAIIRAAKELNVTVIASDLITEPEIRICRDIGCSLTDGPWLDTRSLSGRLSSSDSGEMDASIRRSSHSVPLKSDTSDQLPV